jgi:NAD(P)-dependent dehydrogenase (short-subunit alcohol dehydrogenase family)
VQETFTLGSGLIPGRGPDQEVIVEHVLGRPEDIAAAVAFLAGPDGSWINGQVLRANGGMV